MPFVTSSANTTPAGSDAEVVAITLFPTVAGNDLIAEILLGDDPSTLPTMESVTFSGGVFSPIPGAAVTRTTGSRSARVETWRAANVPAGVTLVQAKASVPATFGVAIGEYSTVRSIGHVVTASGAAVPVTVTVATQDTDNVIVAGFAAEDLAGPTFTGADVGNARELFYVLGAGTPDVPGALLDNSAATPSSVTNTVTTTGQSLWAGVGVELRTSIGAGFRSFQSLWFGPDAGGSTGPVVSPAGGFRSFASLWFGPDGGAGGGGVTPPTVTSGRKLISQAFAATLNGELT